LQNEANLGSQLPSSEDANYGEAQNPNEPNLADRFPAR